MYIISAMETCDAYQPWHDKRTHGTFVRPDSGKCLHDYFYFQDAQIQPVRSACPEGWSTLTNAACAGGMFC
jgi:hypothetical protein